jgi:hypothetical protein
MSEQELPPIIEAMWSRMDTPIIQGGHIARNLTARATANEFARAFAQLALDTAELEDDLRDFAKAQHITQIPGTEMLEYHLTLMLAYYAANIDPDEDWDSEYAEKMGAILGKCDLLTDLFPKLGVHPVAVYKNGKTTTYHS